ncbi:MAG: homocysteine S-methyltransferase family protein [Desulfobacteraceae bacterium]|nr:homocysteine S-methyltransferase family protein [Desulfobacteraceae bacterium]
METLLNKNYKILMEAAINERLRRSDESLLHPTLVNAPLIYDEKGRMALEILYREYVGIAIKSSLPILLLTPTWRANRLRVKNSDVPNAINIDAAHFMVKLRDSIIDQTVDIKIGGLIGCKNDCYKPAEGLSITEAQRFHSWQIDQLVLGAVDYLIAETLPNVQEAAGIAKAMSKTGVPYIISFVISRNGVILDGTKLSDAIEFIDSQTTINPLGYMINCAYPSFLCPEQQESGLFKRLIGYQANASSLDHCDLDGSTQVEANKVSDWGNLMIDLNERYGVRILGGCCGTDGDHLRYLVNK